MHTRLQRLYYDNEKKRLDDDVKSGKISRREADRYLKDYMERLNNLDTNEKSLSAKDIYLNKK